ncbi:MAG: 16S rRNA (cytosine(1402)-N(4))-methyltransferase RsmH [Bacillaceae bacterium]|nr:16S rRNA (cytosine(1402)-N(4))-methyltransferase RsmH [Bacillaceae bacterium]
MFHHITVLKEEAVTGLNIRPDGIYVDCTLGGGGHSLSIASRLTEGGRLLAIDQDDKAIEAAEKVLEPYLDRVTLVKSNFRHIKEIVREQHLGHVDGILFDLGVSSPQLDEEERGFSYHAAAPLDMRMDRSQSLSAADIINEWREEEIADIIYRYGEEKFARRIARRIVAEREKEPIETTDRLADIVKQAIPAAARRKGPHPARRTFQAVRIAVNDELGAFEQALEDGIHLLHPGGRIAVISFHSLEDRICKKMFQSYSRGCTCPPDFPQCVCGNEPIIKVITNKPVLPGEKEIEQNPRARSAKLRIAEKL